MVSRNIYVYVLIGFIKKTTKKKHSCNSNKLIKIMITLYTVGLIFKLLCTMYTTITYTL